MSSYGGGRFAEIYARSRAPSFMDILQASREAKARRESVEFQRQQMERQDQRDTIADDQMRFDRTMRLKEHQQARSDYEAKVKEAQARQEAEATTARAERSARFWASPEVQANQSNPAFQQYAQRLIDDGKINSLDAAPGAAQAQAAMLGIEQPEPPKGPTSFEEYERAKSDPQYAAWLKEEERQRLARAHAVGGKQLPTSAVTDIADADSAIAAVDQMVESFLKNVPSASMVEQIGARGAAHVPNTDTSIYDTEADAATQIFGSHLEGGKMADADFGRYRKMRPGPGDSAETARRKGENLKTLIRRKNEGRKGALGDAGYRVPGQKAKSPGRAAADRVAGPALEILNQPGKTKAERIREAVQQGLLSPDALKLLEDLAQ